MRNNHKVLILWRSLEKFKTKNHANNFHSLPEWCEVFPKAVNFANKFPQGSNARYCLFVFTHFFPISHIFNDT